MSSASTHRYALAVLSLVVAIALLAPSSCARKPHAAFGSGLAKVEATPDAARLEREMFERLNRDRAERGLPTLAYEPHLAGIARSHSLDMKVNGFFGHDSPTTGTPQDRVDRAGYLASESRENVALAPNVPIAQDALLKSPGHYANIVATTVSHVGIGVVLGEPKPGFETNYYFTQLFAKPVAVESESEARTHVLDAIAKQRAKAGLPRLTVHPLLERLAASHVATLDPAHADRSLAKVGDAVAKEMSTATAHGLRSVEAAAQIGLSTRDQPPMPSALAPDVRAIGVAVANGKDSAGKPVTKVLLLLGR